jgi:4-aminobutyrate aminotransferase/(S)-3-amino-2-methylpropionate transaminase
MAQMNANKARYVVLQTEIPGPKSRALSERVAQHTPSSLGHATPLAIASARGALVNDLDGNTFIDFAGGIGTLNSGHCNELVVKAMQQQIEQYLHVCFMVLAYESYVDLAEKLNSITPGSHPKKSVFFNSGAEAVENAVKIARAYTGRPGVIVFDRAFHGRTLLALALTGQVQPYKVGFGPYPGSVERVPYPYAYRCPAGRESCQCNLSCLAPLHDLFRSDLPPDQVACVLVEPVLGEGGFVVPPPSFFPELRRICDQHGILLIADEVQTGFGRTGKMFAMEHTGVVPDLVVMAKSLAGGMPLSAVTGPAEVMDRLVTGSIGGTYGGNPVACKAALAAIEAIESGNLLERAEQIGVVVRSRFLALQQRYPLIGDVRGVGAMLALELVSDPVTKEPATAQTATLVSACLQRGLLVLKAGAAGNCIRTLMPLVITDEQLSEALDIFEDALASI